MEKKYAKYGYLYILPFFIVFTIFSIYPIYHTLELSFLMFHRFTKEYIDVGWQNYQLVLEDNLFYTSLINTVRIWGVNIILQIATAFGLVMVFSDLKYRLKGLNAYRIIFYLPNLIAATSVALLFSLLLSKDYGVINTFLVNVGIIDGVADAIGWLVDSLYAQLSVSGIQTWMWFGNSFILFMASIQAVNKEAIEAAVIDGANRFQILSKIKLPLIKPIIIYVGVTSLIGGLQLFEIPYLLQAPSHANQSLLTVIGYLFDKFQAQNYGVAAATAFILFVIILLVSTIFMLLINKKAVKEKLSLVATRYNNKVSKLRSSKTTTETELVEVKRDSYISSDMEFLEKVIKRPLNGLGKVVTSVGNFLLSIKESIKGFFKKIHNGLAKIFKPIYPVYKPIAPFFNLLGEIIYYTVLKIGKIIFGLLYGVLRLAYEVVKYFVVLVVSILVTIKVIILPNYLFDKELETSVKIKKSLLYYSFISLIRYLIYLIIVLIMDLVSLIGKGLLLILGLLILIRKALVPDFFFDKELTGSDKLKKALLHYTLLFIPVGAYKKIASNKAKNGLASTDYSSTKKLTTTLISILNFIKVLPLLIFVYDLVKATVSIVYKKVKEFLLKIRRIILPDILFDKELTFKEKMVESLKYYTLFSLLARGFKLLLGILIPKVIFDRDASRKEKIKKSIIYYLKGITLVSLITPKGFFERRMGSVEKIKQIFIYYVIYAILGVIVLASLVPFVLVMMNSFRTGLEIQVVGLSFKLSKDFLSTFVDNWDILKTFADIPLGFRNSVKVAFLTTFLSGYVSALTAYGFYLYRFKLNKLLFGFIIIFMMVPTQLAIIGYHKFVTEIGLLGSHYALIIPAIASIGTVFFLRQYASGVVNKEIVESARIDGASEIYIFHKIGIPLMMPGIATMSIFTFIGSWNNYLGARILLTPIPENWTLPLQIANLQGSNVWFLNQGALYLGLAVSIFPIVIVFLYFSRWLIDSIAAGAVKG